VRPRNWGTQSPKKQTKGDSARGIGGGGAHRDLRSQKREKSIGREGRGTKENTETEKEGITYVFSATGGT